MNKDILYPLRRLHGMLHEAKVRHELRKHYQKRFRENSRTVFLLMTPEHGNMGDHAIAQAEVNILKELGIDYIEITGKKLYEMMWANHLCVMNGFPILINGGGNLGTLWMDVEELQREVIRKNPKSSIAILPNTIFYEESEWGQEELRKSIQIYNRHKRLKIYARERISYDYMKPIYRDVRLVPDMVLSLNPQTTYKKRTGCLICLRGDCEKTCTKQQENTIRQQVARIFGDQVTDTDMIVKCGVTVEQRENALNTKFAQFECAELVVTDRLHSMIFCAITGTPCIVVDSKSPKVRGCYEWIKHLDYIRFADDVSDIEQEYNKIPKSEHIYDNAHLKHYYDKLAQDILNIL